MSKKKDMESRKNSNNSTPDNSANEETTKILTADEIMDMAKEKFGLGDEFDGKKIRERLEGLEKKHDDLAKKVDALEKRLPSTATSGDSAAPQQSVAPVPPKGTNIPPDAIPLYFDPHPHNMAVKGSTGFITDDDDINYLSRQTGVPANEIEKERRCLLYSADGSEAIPTNLEIDVLARKIKRVKV